MNILNNIIYKVLARAFILNKNIYFTNNINYESNIGNKIIKKVKI